MGRRLILSGPATDVSGGGVPDRIAKLIGRQGVALTDLRPSGNAMFGDDRIDVVAETNWIDAKTPLEVIRVDGFRVVVRPQTGPNTGGEPNMAHAQENENA